MFKKLWLVFFIIGVLAITAILLADQYVIKQSKHAIFDDLASLPNNRVGLLLGTSKRVRDGHINLYYQYRINAAIELFKAGKIEFILISGDNSEYYYNEPKQMSEDLIARGIPKEKIYLDYAGFSTLDSVVRAQKVFCLDAFTVISQRFHNERAIAIANHKKLQVIGYNARDVSRSAGWKVHLREKLARVKMLWDLSIHRNPKFFGDRIEIE